MILAVESSCDESALALFDPNVGVIGNWIHSQIALHSEYGGVVPDLASREHLQNFTPLLRASKIGAKQISEITQIAVTSGPGLAGCLALGVTFARSLGLAWGKPVAGVNHLRGHALSPFIEMHANAPADFAYNFQASLPHLGLIVSGGNSIVFEISKDRKISTIGQTVDDAAGEALDKGAKLLGMPYPGGPLVEKLASNGDPKVFEFPKAIAPKNERRFSFSGMKTSLRYKIEALADDELEASKADICAGYQAAIVDQLVAKTRHVLRSGHYKSIGLSGGVSNNKALRQAWVKLAARHEVDCYIAEPQYTGDNAAMIGFAAFADPSSADAEPFLIAPSVALATP